MRKLVMAAMAVAVAASLSFPVAVAQPRPPGSPEPQSGGGSSGGPTLRPPGGGSGGGGSGGESAVFGAIAFTADGSYATAWKRATQSEAEAHVAKECAAFGRGACKVIGFPGNLCVALVHYRSRRVRVSVTGGGNTYPEAQSSAMEQCRQHRNTRARGCTLRVVVCGDGR